MRVAALLLALVAAAAIAQDAPVVVPPDAVEWMPVPPSSPPGAHIAFIQGHPAKPGLYTLRVRFPAGYRIPPHFHPANEHVTVLSGSAYIGSGERFDPAQGRHEAETVIQVHGIGPAVVTYVNPADDPRNAAK